MLRILMIATLCLVALSGRAQENDAERELSQQRVPAEAEQMPWRERMLDEMRTWVREEVKEFMLTDAKPLDATVRLTFTLEPKDVGRDTFAVVTATQAFATSVVFQKGDTVFRFEVFGRIEPHRGKYLMMYVCRHGFDSDEGEGHFEYQGSALIGPNESVALGQIGTRSLRVSLASQPSR